MQKKQDLPNPQVGSKASDDDLTCSVCLEQVSAGELIRSLPCLHQVAIDSYCRLIVVKDHDFFLIFSV